MSKRSARSVLHPNSYESGYLLKKTLILNFTMTILFMRSVSFVIALACSLPVLGSDSFTFFHENTLGTSLDLRIAADSREAVVAAEAAVLDEIERLRLVLSSYDANSELRRLLANETSETAISNDLFQVLRFSDHFRSLTNGAFNPNVEAATVLWRKCATEQRLPQIEELCEAITQSQQVAWQVDAKQRTVRRFRIGGVHYSHIIDPRTAKPVTKIVSASVLAEDAATADALATAMSVLEVEESLSLCIGRNVECMDRRFSRVSGQDTDVVASNVRSRPALASRPEAMVQE